MERERVLIADDSSINRELLKEILKTENFDLLEASNGEEALRQVAGQHPALVLLDIMMPVKDGYEVCEEIRNNKASEDVSVIFLSARTNVEDKVRGLELGAVDYITKPFDHREVLARVKSQMMIQKLNRSLKESYGQLQEWQHRIREDLNAAAQIQKSLFPDFFYRQESFHCVWRFIPCETVGGDIFSVLKVDDDHTAVYILDVSGHGVPSAMVALLASQRILDQSGRMLKKTGRANTYEGLVPPSEVIDQLNHEFLFERYGKFFTICYVLINHRTGEARYCNAGHPRPIILRSSGEVDYLEKGGPLIGVDNKQTFEDGTFSLDRGDRLVLYTDGIIEYENGVPKQFGEEAFLDILKSNKHQSIMDICNQLFVELDRHGQKIAPQDDMTFFIAGF